jgi:hypothetical protein
VAVVAVGSDTQPEVAAGCHPNGTARLLVDEGRGKLAVVEDAERALARAAASYRLHGVGGAAVGLHLDQQPLVAIGDVDAKLLGAGERKPRAEDNAGARVAAVESDSRAKRAVEGAVGRDQGGDALRRASSVALYSGQAPAGEDVLHRALGLGLGEHDMKRLGVVSLKQHDVDVGRHRLEQGVC